MIVGGEGNYLRLGLGEGVFRTFSIKSMSLTGRMILLLEAFKHEVNRSFLDKLGGAPF